MLSLRQKLKLCGFAIGIFGCFAIFGLLQEQIFRGRYGDEIGPDGKVGERYTMPITFGAVQCVFFVLFAKALTFTHDHPKNETSQGFYALTGIFYVLGKVTSHMSLQWVPYPTQIVGKSCKPIPVMILGVLIGRKRYSCRKVIFVLTIVMGVMLFIFKDEYTEKDGENPLLGNILIAISLLMDGLCGATEDRMRSVNKPAPLNFMMYMNFWSSIFLLTGVVVFGEGPKVYAFVLKHPEILKFFGIAVVVASFGQIFISSMISNFGPLALSLTTTTRKFFSVCLSVIIFGNHLTYRQWGAASLIFGALIVDALINKPKKNDDAETQNSLTEITEITKPESDRNKNDEKEPEIQGIYIKKAEE
ncbi:solute carrier family 35 member B1 homolog isoform X2 [Bradysia coprophila]|uniref:solute carrier family 35 member B1 homolog isoform X2 n=1 Tax=Bradysia coprophila TaxID=38358 RepID=UPI00187DD084|nr:solute carrier family 35 member B1 homolog isoform X2 [Bradysia coprophila]